MEQIEIFTERLCLRRFLISDASRVQFLAGKKEIADTTANIPHPYLDGLAEKWIATHPISFESGSTVSYAITMRQNMELIGCVSLMNIDSGMPELGYWIGVEYWKFGYCTEACQALIEFCESKYELNAIFGKHLTRNPASGRVMEKCGLSFVSKGVERIGFMSREEEFKLYKKVVA